VAAARGDGGALPLRADALHPWQRHVAQRARPPRPLDSSFVQLRAASCSFVQLRAASCSFVRHGCTPARAAPAPLNRGPGAEPRTANRVQLLAGCLYAEFVPGGEYLIALPLCIFGAAVPSAAPPRPSGTNRTRIQPPGTNRTRIQPPGTNRTRISPPPWGGEQVEPPSSCGRHDARLRGRQGGACCCYMLSYLTCPPPTHPLLYLYIFSARPVASTCRQAAVHTHPRVPPPTALNTHKTALNTHKTALKTHKTALSIHQTRAKYTQNRAKNDT